MVWTLRSRIGAGYVIVLGALIAVIALVFYAFTVASEGAAFAREQAAPSIVASNNLILLVEQMENAEFAYFLSGQDHAQAMKAFDRDEADFRDWYVQAEGLARDPIDRRMLEDIGHDFGSYTQIDTTMRQLLASGKRAEALQMNGLPSERAADAIRAGSRAFRARNLQAVLAIQGREAAALQHTEELTLAIAVVATLLAAIAWNRTSAALVGPLLRLQQAAARLAEGRFGPLPLDPAATRTRELAALRSDFDEMAERLEGLTGALQANNVTLEAQVAERTAALRQALGDLEGVVAQLRSLDALKSNFMATVSHELLTPINFVTGYGSALEDGLLGPLTPAQENAVRELLKGADRLTRMVRNVIEYTQLESGELAVYPEEIALAQIVTAAVESSRPVAAGRHQTLEWEPPAMMPLAWVDPDRIYEIVHELLDNALKFTGEGGKIVVTLSCDDASLLLDVSDSGVGIPPEALGKLFQGFFQAEPGSTRRFGGLGLGLALVHHLITRMSGTITVRSQLGKGTTVRVALPRADRLTEAEPTEHVRQARSRS